MLARSAAGVSLVLVINLSSVALSAQQGSRRDGFWASVGVGGGWNVTDVIADEPSTGVAGYLRAGGAPSGHVSLGTELTGRASEEGDELFSRGNVTLTVLYYPSSTGGFFAKGGFGGAGVAVVTKVANGHQVATAEGFGGTFGWGTISQSPPSSPLPPISTGCSRCSTATTVRKRIPCYCSRSASPSRDLCRGRARSRSLER